MSEQGSGKPVYLAAGVFKLDYKVAGYPELKKVAQEWAKDPGFQELIVRHVSETNFGIQFVYFSAQPQRGRVKQWREELEKRFGKVYAIDCAEYTPGPGREQEDVCDGIVVLCGQRKQ